MTPDRDKELAQNLVQELMEQFRGKRPLDSFVVLAAIRQARREGEDSVKCTSCQESGGPFLCRREVKEVRAEAYLKGQLSMRERIAKLAERPAVGDAGESLLWCEYAGQTFVNEVRRLDPEAKP